MLAKYYNEPENNISTAHQNKRIAPRNIVFILTDDHRFDFMGFTGKLPWLNTPNMDRLYKNGAWFKNAYVTTASKSTFRGHCAVAMATKKHAEMHRNRSFIRDKALRVPG